MNTYATTVRAIGLDGEMHSYVGVNVPGVSVKDAQAYCENNGLGYCKVSGILISEIPCKVGSYDPDWDKKVNYEYPYLN